ncbi:MAG: flagellin [Hahellaceae bacterium]|nr:flagellin [Hahellaceae bacterium]MCP5211754.1 flagellin [Hahellaceae bacterium]
MPQIINTNIASLNAQRQLDSSQKAGDKALQRLSSGLRINSAKDDAAGLAISNRFNAQIRGTSVASRNAGDGVSLAQTAEGALNSMQESLQRIRELALQSANGSNTDLERSSLQEEVEQLKSEISAISEKTNFNGRNLLDGSFQNVNFQTGANVGETINVSISKVTADTLGTSLSNGISSSTTISTAALAAGDLTINGISVGASSGADDGASTSIAEKSAIAISAAINKVSDLTGVEAVANATTKAGVDDVAGGIDAAAATLILNGTTINISGSGNAANAAADLKGIADTINLYKDQTGVSASIDINNLAAGITLTAADGRNIEQTGTAAAGNYGIGANGTSTGTYTLISKDGSDITVGSTTGNSLESAGIEVGTYSGSNSGVNSSTVSNAALATGDLTINGVSVGASLASDDTASTASKSASAISKAAAINRVSEQTGVTAVAQNTQVTSAAISNTTTITGVSINGTTIGDAGGSSIGEKLAAFVDAVNQKTAATGVRAEVLDGDQFQLIADDGRNIDIAGSAADATDGLTTSAGTNRGTITLQSAGQIEIGTANATGPGAAGFRVGTYGGGETGTLLKDIDVSTVAGANEAIKGIDNAINQVSRAQAALGAVQNRFEQTISNLAVQGENLSAANSRIRDADFASETAALSRAQVLQQAGISVLSQANARPQQALSLLQ